MKKLIWILILMLSVAIALASPGHLGVVQTKNFIGFPVYALDTTVGIRRRPDSVYLHIFYGRLASTPSFTTRLAGTWATAGDMIDSFKISSQAQSVFMYHDSVGRIDADSGAGHYWGLLQTYYQTAITDFAFQFQLVDSGYNNTLKRAAENLDAAVSSRSTLVVGDNIGINWADVSNPTTAVDLSATTIRSTDSALQIGANGVDAAAIGTGAIDDDAVADGTIDHGGEYDTTGSATSVWNHGTRILTAGTNVTDSVNNAITATNKANFMRWTAAQRDSVLNAILDANKVNFGRWTAAQLDSVLQALDYTNNTHATVRQVASTVATVTNVTTVNGLAANVITAASINDGAIGATEIADGTIDSNTFTSDAKVMISIAPWYADTSNSAWNGLLNKFGEWNAAAQAATGAGSGLDSATTSRILGRKIWGVPAGSGSDSTAVALRYIANAGGGGGAWPVYDKTIQIDAAGATAKRQFVIDTATAFGGNRLWYERRSVTFIRQHNFKTVIERMAVSGANCTLQVVDSLPFAIQAGTDVDSVRFGAFPTEIWASMNDFYSWDEIDDSIRLEILNADISSGYGANSLARYMKLTGDSTLQLSVTATGVGIMRRGEVVAFIDLDTSSGGISYTINARDTVNSLPVNGAQIVFYTTADVFAGDGGTTDANGNRTVAILPGTYKVQLSTTSNAIVFPVRTVTLTAADTDTINGGAKIISAPIDPMLCRVYQDVFDLSWVGVEATIKAQLQSSTARRLSDSTIVQTAAVSAVADSTGAWYIDLIPSDSLIAVDKRYTFTIFRGVNAIVTKKDITVPATGTWRLKW